MAGIVNVQKTEDAHSRSDKQQYVRGLNPIAGEPFDENAQNPRIAKRYQAVDKE
jgi:hypothetical protein